MLRNNFLKKGIASRSLLTSRCVNSCFNFSSVDGFIKTRRNTLINICNQNENIVVERFGKFSRLQKPGVFISIPFVDKLKYCVDIRELTIPIAPQLTITEDNVSVALSGVIYIKIVDPVKAAYGVNDPIFAVSQFSQSSMRAIVGKHTLDSLFNSRSLINDYITKSVKEGSEDWGINVLRYEVLEVSVSQQIQDAMIKQATAERKRREEVLHAEALKKSQILESEGLKQKLINESEGMKIKTENEAAAEANAIKIKADAFKYQHIVQQQARADALKILGESLKTVEGMKAAQLELGTSYIKEFGNIVGKSNSIIVPGDASDVNNTLIKAMSIANMYNSGNINTQEINPKL